MIERATMPADDFGVGASRLRLLTRIAETLDVPVSALYEPEGSQADRSNHRLRAEARALLAAFVSIRDPERRRACIAYVTAVAQGARAEDEPGSDRDDR